MGSLLPSGTRRPLGLDRFDRQALGPGQGALRRGALDRDHQDVVALPVREELEPAVDRNPHGEAAGAVQLAQVLARAALVADAVAFAVPELPGVRDRCGL